MLSTAVLIDSAGRAVTNPGVLPQAVSELAGVVYTSPLGFGSPQGATSVVRSTPGVQFDRLFYGPCRLYALDLVLLAASTELSSFSIQLFDTLSGPGAGEVPVWSAWFEAGDTSPLVKSLPALPGGLYFANGIWVALSKNATLYADPTLSGFTASTIIAQGLIGDINA
jgi:hypothetical protein